ncbi:nucleotide disphospho-sugar-binding domain-containing protein [Aeromicrobium sp. CF3.5]|uniref:nucleotide disphospho-sugar-binding domain-containing protein n=1 Tax=Aeromicrobium sp. CF3.5 TaxID=3373078 RepID=UPI003EE81F23
MRVLFVPSINRSQAYTMTPLAWALRTAGHQVRMAVPPDLVGEIAGTGISPTPVGPSRVDLEQDMKDAEPVEDPVAPIPTPDERSRQVEYGWGDAATTFTHLTTDFFQLLTPDDFTESLIDYCQQWRPDLVIWNTLAFAAPVAARVSGAAHARMPWGVDTLAQIRAADCKARATTGAADPMETWLAPFLRKHGHEYDEEMVLGQWTIDPAPPWTFHADAGVRYVPMRALSFNGPAPVPSWVDEPLERRRVCLTLGLSSRESHGVEASPAKLLEAVADLDIEVVATFNESQVSGNVPDNVRLVDFVPLGALLPSCSAVVHHGGPGSFSSALEHGVPQLIVPGGYWHIKWWGGVAQANGLEDEGAGIYLADSPHLTPERVREGLHQVLDTPSYATNAARLQREWAGIPSPNEIVPALERLTAEHQARKTAPHR